MAVPERAFAVKEVLPEYLEFLWFALRTVLAKAQQLCFGERFYGVKAAWGGMGIVLGISSRIAQGLLIGFGRSRSFHGDCTPSHPFVDPLPYGKRSGRRRLDDLARNDSLRPSCVAKLVRIRATFCLGILPANPPATSD